MTPVIMLAGSLRSSKATCSTRPLPHPVLHAFALLQPLWVALALELALLEQLGVPLAMALLEQRGVPLELALLEQLGVPLELALQIQ